MVELVISPQLWGVEKREVHSGFRFSMPLLISSAGLPVLVAGVPAIGGAALSGAVRRALIELDGRLRWPTKRRPRWSSAKRCLLVATEPSSQELQTTPNTDQERITFTIPAKLKRCRRRDAADYFRAQRVYRY